MITSYQPLPAAIGAVQDARLKMLSGNKEFSSYYIAEANYHLRRWIQSTSKTSSDYGKSK
jgi:hypothetical protein